MSTKLVAREGENLQSFLAIVIGKLIKLGITFLRKTSLGGNVGDNHHITLILGHVDVGLAIDQLISNAMEGSDGGNLLCAEETQITEVLKTFDEPDHDREERLFDCC